MPNCFWCLVFDASLFFWIFFAGVYASVRIVLRMAGCLWVVGCFLCFFMESLILAQDERWRRA